MAKLKVSEMFYSLQGEGRYIGVPSVFLRTFGCNFTCRNWGRAFGTEDWVPDGQDNPEVAAIAEKAKEYDTYESLPLVKTGCDSYASWHPKFKHLSPVRDTDELAQDIVDTLPHKRWVNEHLVITGGEPLLGWQRAYVSLLQTLPMQGLKELTFETNGTKKLQPELKAYLADRFAWNDLTFSVSAKLPCSGHPLDEAILPEIVAEYNEIGYTYLKFVVATEEDLADAEEAIERYRAGGVNVPIYLMGIGGTEESYTLNQRAVAQMAMDKGYRYSDRLQVPLFKNEWGT